MKTKLQRFIALMGNDIPNVEEFTLAHFNNQDSDYYDVEGERYYIFSKEQVQDILDEDFENELEDLIYYLKKTNDFYAIAESVESGVKLGHNYKTVEMSYDNLEEYNYVTDDDEVYIYTKY